MYNRAISCRGWLHDTATWFVMIPEPLAHFATRDSQCLCSGVDLRFSGHGLVLPTLKQLLLSSAVVQDAIHGRKMCDGFRRMFLADCPCCRDSGAGDTTLCPWGQPTCLSEPSEESALRVMCTRRVVHNVTDSRGLCLVVGKWTVQMQVLWRFGGGPAFAIR